MTYFRWSVASITEVGPLSLKLEAPAIVRGDISLATQMKYEYWYS